MIEEVLEDISNLDSELYVILEQAVLQLTPIQKLVLWYWLLGFTQEETRHRIYPGRSRAHVWQVKKTALESLKNALDNTTHIMDL